MHYQQVQAPPSPPQSINNGGGCLILTVIICGSIWILITISVAAQAISVENYVLWLLLGAGTVFSYIWVTKHKKEEQLREAQTRHAMLQ
jgi:apolipoprotein N-acyltransferase